LAVRLQMKLGVIAEPATQVRILFDKRWAHYVEEHIWHASQKVERLADGRALLHMQVGGTAELRQWILSFGAGAEVQEPAKLRDEVVAELRGALARYEDKREGPARSRRPPN